MLIPNWKSTPIRKALGMLVSCGSAFQKGIAMIVHKPVTNEQAGAALDLHICLGLMMP